MRKGDEQPQSRFLTFRESLDLRRSVQRKRLPQFLGVRVVPSGIKRALIANQLLNAHPSRQVIFLGEIPDARQHSDRIGDRIVTEDAHRAAFRAQQAENVSDERRLACSVCADKAVDRAA